MKQMVEYYIILVRNTRRNILVIGGDNICEMPDLNFAYITVHYSAVFLVRLQNEDRECLFDLI